LSTPTQESAFGARKASDACTAVLPQRAFRVRTDSKAMTNDTEAPSTSSSVQASLAQPQQPARLHGIDVCLTGDNIPDSVGSWRVILGWGIVVSGIIFAASFAGRLSGVGRIWGVPAAVVFIFSTWGIISLALALFRVFKLRAKGGTTDAEPSTLKLPLQEQDVPKKGDPNARLQLVGKPEDISRVLALVQPRTRFEPFIVRPSAAAHFLMPTKKKIETQSVVKLAVPGWKRFAIILVAAVILWGINTTTEKLFQIRPVSGVLGIFVWISLGVLLAELLVPTYLRILPQRLDIMTFIPPGLGGEQAPQASDNTLISDRCHTYVFDLTRARVSINIKSGVARIDDAERPTQPSVYVRAGNLVFRSLSSEALVWAALLNAALCHVPSPPVPMDRLTE
jgi:hypothetical protein